MTGPTRDPAPTATQLLADACGYPWGVPAQSSVFCAGELHQLVAWDADAPARARVRVAGGEVALGDLAGAQAGALRDRRPVLAYGSNASLSALTRKFGAGELIPILRGQVAGCDVVYSAHIAAYGSIPATLQGSPGTTVPAWVMWLCGRQLATLHATEPNYRSASGLAVAVDLDLGGRVSGPDAYVSRHGCLRLNSGAVALEAIPAHQRTLPVLSQREVLEILRRRLGFTGSLEAFVAGNVADPALGARHTDRLRADAVPFAEP